LLTIIKLRTIDAPREKNNIDLAIIAFSSVKNKGELINNPINIMNTIYIIKDIKLHLTLDLSLLDISLLPRLRVLID